MTQLNEDLGIVWDALKRHISGFEDIIPALRKEPEIVELLAGAVHFFFCALFTV